MDAASDAAARPAEKVTAAKHVFTLDERAVLVRSFEYLARHPDVLDDLCRVNDFRKESVDHLAASFVVLAGASQCFHPTWLALMTPCLAGVRLPSPLTVALLQAYLVQQASAWAQAILAPFFARMDVGKMKRKRSMKDQELIESFQIVLELVTSDEALSALPRNVQALMGLTWVFARNLGLDGPARIEMVADLFFLRLVYPVLLVPDQYGLVDKPLKSLVKEILQGVTKVFSACVYGADVTATPFACAAPLIKPSTARMAAFVERLVVDPLQHGWAEFVNFPTAALAVPHELGDAGVGMWLHLLLQCGPATKDAGLRALVGELEVVGSELERRRAIASVVNEEQEYTLRLDGVTFWLRDLDYGVMMEGTALRIANEWLKKVNQLRAVLRISLNKRTHFTQWNGRISDLVDAADFSVFAEFGKVLKNSLPIVANSVDQSLERAILTYKRDTSRDPLRDLLALLVHGKTLLTRLSRLPPARDPEERVRLEEALGRAASHLSDELASDISEVVRLHQMQTSIIMGWGSFPESLLEHSGLVRVGRRQVMYGKVTVVLPAALKAAKYAMLLTDVVVLLEAVPPQKFENESSARNREEFFGGGNAFQPVVAPTTLSKVARDKGNKKGTPSGLDVSFRMIGCINLVGARLRLKASGFVVTEKSGRSVEVTVSASQKLEWFTAWARIDILEAAAVPLGSGGTVTEAAGASLQGHGGAAGGASGGGGTGLGAGGDESAAGSSPPTSPRGEEDVDEIEALMALGMYDTAVLKKPEEAPSEADNQFNSMIGQIKRRDGKERISLQALFTPPPGLVVKVWQDSLRHMKSPAADDNDDEDDDDAEDAKLALSPQSTAKRPSPNPRVAALRAGGAASPREGSEDTEELQLRRMLASVQLTLRFGLVGTPTSAESTNQE